MICDDRRSPRPPSLWGAATDAGRVRTRTRTPTSPSRWCSCVADGMGGHQAGEVASALASSTLRERLSNGATSRRRGVAVATVVEANAAIFQTRTRQRRPARHGHHAHRDGRAAGRPTGPSADQFAIVNVGDSRVYLMRAGRLTARHRRPQLRAGAAGHRPHHRGRGPGSHPRRNIVTRALGIEPTCGSTRGCACRPFSGDRFVLCSDGLVDEVDDDEIHSC